MKPKIQNSKNILLKKKLKKEKKISTNDAPAPPLSAASAALPSAAKAKKRQLLRLQKIEKQVGRLAVPPLEGSKKLGKKKKQQQEQLLPTAPSSDAPAETGQMSTEQSQQQQLRQPQQPKNQKRKRQATQAPEDKRPRMQNGSDGAPPDTAASDAAAVQVRPAPGYMQDTGPVRDPVLRADIAACMAQRAACTVRVRPLPNRLRLAQICELAKGVQAARVPWNYATGRNKGVAFLEFPSERAAQSALGELRACKTLGTRLSPEIVAATTANGSASIDVDAYNCRRVVVTSLHPATTGQELKDLVAAGGIAALQRVDFQMGSKNLRKHAPALAFLTFADERRALEAVQKFQGHVIRGRSTSWFFQKRYEKPEQARHPTQLVAFGVSKRVSDADLLKAFPNSQSLDVKQEHGMAIVTYAGDADCRKDFEAFKGGVVKIGKARLRVQYGHAQYKPPEQRLAEKPQQPKPPRKQPQAPPKPLNIDPSLFNKSQLVVKNFKPNTQDADLAGFLQGVRRVFFTANRRLAFVHFQSDAAASQALAKLAKEPLNGAKLKAMYAMDKPDKKKGNRQQQGEPQSEQKEEQQQQQPQPEQDASMAEADETATHPAVEKPAQPMKKKLFPKKKMMTGGSLAAAAAGAGAGGVGKMRKEARLPGKKKAFRVAGGKGVRKISSA